MLKKLYIGCSLTQAPSDFIEFIDQLKTELKSHFQILDFLGLVAGTSQDVYKYDRQCVLDSDLFLAICDYPSTGLGMEIGFAIENNKKTIVAYGQNSKVTRMVLGIDSPNVAQLKYNNISDILTHLIPQPLERGL